MFNQEIKELFLEKYKNEDTQDVYSRIFKRSLEMETQLQKDLYDFDQQEFERYIGQFLIPKSKDSVRVYCNVLINYVEWAIEKGYRKDIYNPIKRSAEYFYEFVKEAKVYITFEEKEAILSNLVNKQDEFIFEGLWQGIQGAQVCELVNLKVTDIDVKHRKIDLRDKDGKIRRSLKVDEDDKTVIEIALLANKEKEYFKANGTVDYSPYVKESFELFPSEYVLKSANSQRKGKSTGAKITHYTVYNRLETIRFLDEMEEFVDALISKNIVRSGMIYMALKLFKRDKELEKKQIQEICDKYNLKYKWALRDYLNVEMLRSLYPKEMEQAESQIAMDK